MNKTKVDLITGFLGAGKTTFIRRYLKHLDQKDVSYAVIENEFGSSSVDSALLGEHVRELTGGCICCGQKVNFHNLLLELAEQVERIIIEPSGIFNADDFFDIMDSPLVQAAAEYGFMAGVVDPLSLAAMQETDRRILLSETCCAGAILISHTDRLGQSAVEKACLALQDILPALPPVFDSHAVDFDSLITCAPVRRPHIRDTADHSALYRSAALRPSGIYDEPAVHRVVARLFSREAGDVLRVKGTLRGTDQPLLINAVRGETELIPSEGEILINIIGRNLSRAAIREILNSESITR